MPTQIEQNLLTRIKQDYDFAKVERDKRTGDWDTWEDQYDSTFHDLELDEDESEDDLLFVPKTKSVIHRLECSAREQFLQTRAGFKLTRVVPTTGQPGKYIAAELLDTVLHAKVDLELRPVLTMQSQFHSGLVYGAGVVKAGWEKTEIKTQRGVMSKSKPTLSFQPLRNIVWDPYATSLDEIGFVIVEVYLTADQLWDRQQRGIYQNVTKVFEAAREERDHRRQDRSSPSNSARDIYKVLEFWGPQQLIPESDLQRAHHQGQHVQSRDILATVYEDKVLLRVEDNPYASLMSNPTPFEKLPFFIMCPLPKENETYGYSFPEWMRPLQRETNLLRNQRRQAVSMELGRKVFFDQTKSIDLDAAKEAKYGGMVGVNGPPRDAIYDFAPHNTTSYMAQEEMVVDRDIQDLTGVNDYLMGSTTPGMQKTATGVSILTQEGNAKQDVVMENMAETSILPMVKFFALCAARYVDPLEVQAIAGKLTTPPRLSDVLGDDFQIELEVGMSNVSKQARIQQLQFSLNAVAQVAGVMPQVAMPAMIQFTAELLKLQGVGSAGAYIAGVAQQLQNQAMQQMLPPSQPQPQAQTQPGRDGTALTTDRQRSPRETSLNVAGR